MQEEKEPAGSAEDVKDWGGTTCFAIVNDM